MSGSEAVGRAQLVGAVEPASSLLEAAKILRVLEAVSASQASAVVEVSAETVAAWGLADHADAPAGGREVSIIYYTPERVIIHARSERPSFLILKDAYYPGWHAAVNGEPVEIVATNVLFRGVPVPCRRKRGRFFRTGRQPGRPVCASAWRAASSCCCWLWGRFGSAWTRKR